MLGAQGKTLGSLDGVCPLYEGVSVQVRHSQVKATITYSSNVGNANQSVLPRSAVLTRNIRAIFKVALKMSFFEDGLEGSVAP